MNILFIASEVAPFAKSGGLADVAGALPKALQKLGHDVRVVMPRYYDVDKKKYDLKAHEGALCINMGPLGKLCVEIYKAKIPKSKVSIYFIEYDDFFERKGLYDENGIAYEDNAERFILLSKAAMELAKRLDFHPDVIHAHDWHSASASMLLNTTYAFDPHFAYTGSLLTLHNLEHQGKFHKKTMDILGIGWEHFVSDELEEYDGVNLLKGGIVHADAINAVSKKYAHEITTAAFGFGLDGVIKRYEYKLSGILNGVDYTEWSPKDDVLIAAPFDADSLDGKKLSKADLQRSFGLEVREDVALVGFVGRLVEQKGISLIRSAFEEMMSLEIQFVLLGTGEGSHEKFFRQKAAQYQGQFGCHIGYDNTLAHKIEAGSDIFLMPSLFEPCGLNQIYSLRYGTIPLVRATGGLDDTIENYDAAQKSGTGFKFYEASQKALIGTLRWAVDTYTNDKEGFAKLIQNAMSKRFSWKESALEYQTLYERIIEGRKP